MNLSVIYGKVNFQLNLPIGSEYPNDNWVSPNIPLLYDLYARAYTRHRTSMVKWRESQQCLTKMYTGDGLTKYTKNELIRIVKFDSKNRL